MKTAVDVSFKNTLQQYCQKLNHPLPVYETKQIDEQSFKSSVRFYREGHSLGSQPCECHCICAFPTKKAAEQSAAEEALRFLSN